MALGQLREMLRGWKEDSMLVNLQPFTSYWSEVATFSYPLAFNTSVGGVPIEIPGKSLVLRKLESWGYHQAVKTV